MSSADFEATSQLFVRDARGRVRLPSASGVFVTSDAARVVLRPKPEARSVAIDSVATGARRLPVGLGLLAGSVVSLGMWALAIQGAGVLMGGQSAAAQPVRSASAAVHARIVEQVDVTATFAPGPAGTFGETQRGGHVFLAPNPLNGASRGVRPGRPEVLLVFN